MKLKAGVALHAKRSIMEVSQTKHDNAHNVINVTATKEKHDDNNVNNHYNNRRNNHKNVA